MQDGELAADLEQLATPCDREARAAYERLAAPARSYLERHLRSRFQADRETCEDVAQDALARIWRARAGFRNEGPAAWHGLLRRVADRCYLDLVARRVPVDTGTPAMDELPERELPADADTVAALLQAAESGALQHHADVLWLGLETGISPEAQTRKLLAAQLYYLEGAPLERIVRLLNAGRQGESALTAGNVREWLAEPGTVRHLVYGELYYSNDRLTALLLGLPEDDTAVLDEWARRTPGPEPHAPATAGWTRAEAAVLLWRFRAGLTEAQILARRDCPVSAESLSRLLERSRALFPFDSVMGELLERLAAPAAGPAPMQEGAARGWLRSAGLWQRLAFQYRYADELAHREIEERIAPPARRVEYAVTAASLNVWLSGRRLLARLLGYCSAQGEASPHD